MKQLLSSFCIACLALWFTSCSEDFTVAAPYKDITIVYGFINMADTAQYIRIQKAFLDENKTAIDMAKEADSNFFKSLDVRMKEFNNGTMVSNTQLNRVDMTAEGYPKDTGVFFNTPNYAYKFKKAIIPTYRYRLVITNTSTGKVDSSEIEIIDPSGVKIQELANVSFVLNFTPLRPENIAIFRLNYLVPTAAKYIEGRFVFHWVDKDISTNVQTDHQAELVFDSKAVDGGKQISLPKIQVYSFLRDVMQAAPNNIERYMDSTDVYLYTGGQDYYNYYVTNAVQSGGLTADQLRPNYTNILGGDVYGLFSTRAYNGRKSVGFNSTTLDSLKLSDITKPLNIKGVSDH